MSFLSAMQVEKINERIKYWATKLEKAKLKNNVKAVNKCIGMIQMLELLLESNME